MNTFLFSAFAFIITISFLVFIHEYGHFWMARRFGVRIEKFSVGFGKPIFKWHGKRDNTEYSLSWIPLGGYVKMYGETPEALHDSSATVDVSSDIPRNGNTQHNGSFSALPPFKRLLIAFAGPAVNLIFAVLALWVLFLIGVPAFKPTIGTIHESSPLAMSSVSKGDTIIAIDGHQIDSMTDAALRLVDTLGSNSITLVTESSTGKEHSATIDLSQFTAGQEMAVEQVAGFNWAISEVNQNVPAIINSVGEGTPAEKAGLKTNDKIIMVDSVPINTWQQFVSAVVPNPQKNISLQIMRSGEVVDLSMLVGQHPRDTNKGYAGVSPQIDSQVFDAFRTTKRFGMLEALPKSISANILQGELMLKTLWRLVVGKASIENLGGPLSIADYSGQSLSAGYVTYFKFLASISLILAVMNLLPIPVLDGGHILMCLVEMIRGKPLSDKSLDILMRVGGAFLLTFMVFVITVDVWRYVFK